MTHTAPQRRAFTLIELLVVIGIIAVVASLTVVVYSKAMKSAGKTAISYQLQAIQVALDAYKTEFGSFPTTSLDGPGANNADDEINRAGLRGARTLCKALMGQTPQGANFSGTVFQTVYPNQDGANGFGFRVPSRSGVWQVDTTKTPYEVKGKVYGPFLAEGKFRVCNTDYNTIADDVKFDRLALDNKNYDDTAVLLDANNKPILYYPVLNPQPNLTIAKTYIGAGPSTIAPNDPLPMYRYNDNDTLLPQAMFAQLLGDKDNNGAIGTGETAAVRGKPILWSPGPDGFYGYNTDPRATEKAKREMDDVTNFDQ